LVNGPLPIDGVCTIVLEYGAEFEGRRMREIKFPWGVGSIIELHDGKFALACDDEMVRVVDFESGECVHTLAGHTSLVRDLAVLPDGKLASCSWDRTVRVWDNNTCLFTLVGHTDWVSALVVLPDGKLASSSSDRTVRVWDVASGACLLTLVGHTSVVYALAVLPDGKLASGSTDATVRVWDAATGACLLTLAGHTLGVTALAALPGGKLASVSIDKTVRVWDVVNGGACTLLGTLLGEHAFEVYTLAVFPDGKLMSADKTVRVWDATSGECLMTLHEDFKVSQALVLSNGNLAVRLGTGTIHVYE
jgi:WD40 repeat protein